MQQPEGSPEQLIMPSPRASGGSALRALRRLQGAFSLQQLMSSFLALKMEANWTWR